MLIEKIEIKNKKKIRMSKKKNEQIKLTLDCHENLSDFLAMAETQNCRVVPT